MLQALEFETAPMSSGSAAEWATAAVALVALVVSVCAFQVALRTERRKLFIELQDRLTSEQLQRGRALMHRRLTSEFGLKLLKESEEEFGEVNRAIGMFNTLGIYTRHRYVDRRLVLEHWGPRVREAWPLMERFLKDRREQIHDEAMWSYLVWLAQKSNANVADDVRLTLGWRRRLRTAGGGSAGSHS